MAVLRILLMIVVVLAALWALWGLLRQSTDSPERRLGRQFREMRELILEGVDDDERQRAARLLDDLGNYLDALIRAQKKLDVLDRMAEAASEMTGTPAEVDARRLEERVQNNLAHFLDEMERIASEVDYDWRQSIRRLEDFTDEIEQRRQAFEELEELDELVALEASEGSEEGEPSEQREYVER